jgi:hypothetical protein
LFKAHLSQSDKVKEYNSMQNCLPWQPKEKTLKIFFQKEPKEQELRYLA